LPVQSRLNVKRYPLLGKILRAMSLDLLYMRTLRKRALEKPQRDAQSIFRSAHAHAVYHEGGIEIYESYGVIKENIFVVRNSPNTESLIEAADKHSSNTRHQRLLHIGRLVEWKRVDLLICAVADLRNSGFPELELVVIGYGPAETDLKTLAKELGVDEAVQFLGGIYDPTLLAEQAMCSSIYVLAGMGGLSINEAMCFGLPIVCSRCDGTEKFLVREEVNGLYFQEGELSELTRKLAALLTDDELRKSMGYMSRMLIENEINTEIHVNNYLEMFEKLTEKPLERYRSPLNEVPRQAISARKN